MPPNTVKVDRSTPWGNPFAVGRDGTQAECLQHYRHLLDGELCLTRGPGLQKQDDYRAHVDKHLGELRGKSLACWCAIGSPCHADVLLQRANRVS